MFIVFDFKLDESQPSEVEWSEIGTIIVGKYRGGGRPSDRIAAFDFDYTLVKTKSGKVFNQDANDWMLLHPGLPKALARTTEAGYRFVVISNQGGIEKGKVTVAEMKKRFNDSLKSLGVPCTVLIATRDDQYRKPRIGLWTYLLETIQQSSIEINYQESFYVGDAAGRKKSAICKADHSSADLFFAINAGLSFMLPETFLSKSTGSLTVVDQTSSLLRQSDNGFRPSPPAPEPRPAASSAILLREGALPRVLTSILPSAKHCIIFCGMSASGKSTFYREHLAPLKYVHISRDVLQSMGKCESLARQTLSSSSSSAPRNCVIDNTNVDKASRAKWIDLVKASGGLPLVFYFALPLKHIFHNNTFRKLTMAPGGGQSTVTSVLLYTQNKRLEVPTAAEGAPVYEVSFVPTFTAESHKRLYYSYLNDK